VECKFWNSAVERQDIDTLANTVREVGASRGVIFSTKGFQSGAVKQAEHDHLDLYRVRDLSSEEWGLPGRVVDIFLQIVQPGIGNVVTYDTYKIGNPLNTAPIAFALEFGLDGPLSCTPTLKRDGSPGGDPIEKYIFDCAQQTLRKRLAEIQMINGGGECTRYVKAPVNMLPDMPFRIPRDGEILVVPRMSFDLGIKFLQSRITVDRAKRYRFVLALENFITGSISAASQPLDIALTTLAELDMSKPSAPGQPPFVNGSLMRVVVGGLFPIEEMEGLSPVPIEAVRQPFIAPPLPQQD